MRAHSELNTSSVFAMLFLICLCFLVVPIEAQDYLDGFELVLQNDSVDQDFDYTLVVYSGHRCGYCSKLRNDFQDAQIPKNLKIVFIEQDTDQEWILEASNSYRGSEVYVHADNSSHPASFLPSAILFDSSGKELKKFKGYKEDFWQAVIKKAS